MDGKTWIIYYQFTTDDETNMGREHFLFLMAVRRAAKKEKISIKSDNEQHMKRVCRVGMEHVISAKHKKTSQSIKMRFRLWGG